MTILMRILQSGFLISASRDIVIRKLTKIFTFYFAVLVFIAVVGTFFKLP